jgi:methyl-accepting chemotaxis protein
MRTTALASPEFYRSRPVKKGSLWEMKSILQKRTTIFLTVLILLSMLLSGLAIYNYNRVELQPATGLEAGLAAISIAILVVLILFMLFLRIKVIKPLHRLDELSRKMADGNLDILAKNDHETKSYVDTIGENVNSLAMNLQEILLLVWNMSEHNLRTIDEIANRLTSNNENYGIEEMKSDLQSMKTELLQMQALAQQFELFDVAFKGKKPLAKDDSANP